MFQLRCLVDKKKRESKVSRVTSEEGRKEEGRYRKFRFLDFILSYNINQKIQFSFLVPYFVISCDCFTFQKNKSIYFWVVLIFNFHLFVISLCCVCVFLFIVLFFSMFYLWYYISLHYVMLCHITVFYCLYFYDLIH